MKKLIFVLLIPVLLLTSGCNQRKKEIARLQAQNDSLRAVGGNKDSNIAEFVTTFNEIESNLDSIKQVERVINKTTSRPHAKSKSRAISLTFMIFSRRTVNWLLASQQN